MDISSFSARQVGGQVVGDFRLRLTVGAGRALEVAGWARQWGFALESGVLDRGRTQGRPTVVLDGRGDLAAERAAAGRWAARLASDGFRVVRTRIEAAPWNDGVPTTDREAAFQPDRWFAHRVTVRLPLPYDTRRLSALAGLHTAHLSRRVRTAPARGVQERVVVQCARGVGRQGARARLEDLLNGLAEAELRPVDVEEAYVVYDDGPAGVL
ncbi:hypothetical protein [Streptomyces fuscigenes]|uniref:hypothetical protein n=1 Tax=Streptomyces fuscigenes TaxID=1528880 RepID=UPI001F3EF83C|nr:hypothetical protein [Streptomyces fuscigenes]MCF3962689.1 hypothetical protein [Streptomyces fuscigenes]